MTNHIMYYVVDFEDERYNKPKDINTFDDLDEAISHFLEVLKERRTDFGTFKDYQMNDDFVKRTFTNKQNGEGFIVVERLIMFDTNIKSRNERVDTILKTIREIKLKDLLD